MHRSEYRALTVLAHIPTATFSASKFSEAYRRVYHVEMLRTSITGLLRKMIKLGYLELIKDDELLESGNIYREARTRKAT